MKNTSFRSSACRRLALSLGYLALVSIVWPGLSIAEDRPSRGRLPDGRAFRTDPQGHELVDYIAELELSVETLTRRVHGLEDELSEKSAALERVEAGKPATVKLVEKDLIVENPPSVKAPEDKPAANDSAKAAPKDDAEEKRLRIELAEARKALELALAEQTKRQKDEALAKEADEERLRLELTEAKKALELALAEAAEKEKSSAKLEETLQALRTKLDSSERALAAEKKQHARAVESPSTKPEPVQAAAAVEEKIASLDVQVATCNAKLQSAATDRSSLAEAEARVSRLETELGEVRAELASKERELVQVTSRLGRAEEAAEVRARASFAALERSDPRSVQTARASLVKEISTLNVLVGTRDKLYYDSRKLRRGHTPDTKLSRLITDRGHSIGYIASRGRAAGSVSEIEALREEVKSIRSVVEGDISQLRARIRNG